MKIRVWVSGYVKKSHYLYRIQGEIYSSVKQLNNVSQMLIKLNFQFHLCNKNIFISNNDAIILKKKIRHVIKFFSIYLYKIFNFTKVLKRRIMSIKLKVSKFAQTRSPLLLFLLVYSAFDMITSLNAKLNNGTP